MIKKIWAVSFSPTGSTAQMVLAAAEAAARALACGDAESLSSTAAACPASRPIEQVDVSRPDMRERPLQFGEEDLVFAAVPTYAGRVPNKIMPFFRDMVKGCGAFGVPMVTFGGRSFDDSLAELSDLMEESGFRLLGGGAFVCRHAFADVASDRPAAEDLEMAAALGRGAAENLQAGRILPASQLPGNHPAEPYYVPKGTDGQPAVFLKAKPKLDSARCTGCGRCAESCPMGSIDRDTLQAAGICIKCQACIRKCSEGARYFDDPAFLSHKAMLEESFGSVRRESRIVL